MKPQLLLITVLIILTSCTSDSMFDEGKVSETAEETIITFKPVEISDGLFLIEEDVIDKETNELTMNLEFESDFFSGEHEFILNIPKEFAGHVDDITFSTEPDNILNEDPSVSWFIKLEKKHRMIITANMDLSRQKNTEAVDFVEALEYIRFYAKVRQCSNADDKTEECYVHLLTKYKDFITLNDCAGTDYYPERAACRAYIEDNPNYCGDSEPCKNILSGLKWENCDDEECRLKASIESGSKDDCELFINKRSKQKCYAGVTQDDSYCDALLDNDDAYDDCCMTINDEAQRERCLAYNDEESHEMTPERCYAMEEGTWKNMCFRYVAKDLCKVQYCLELEKSKQRGCIMDMRCSVSACNHIEGNMKYECMYYAAQSKNDCDMIEGEYQPLSSSHTYNKDKCLEKFS